MKQTIITIIALITPLLVSAQSYVVNTTDLCQAKGYKDKTPVEVYINDGKVEKIVALPNKESKGYFARVVKTLLPKYEGLTISKAKKLAKKQSVDGLTGATLSTVAVQKNIEAALKEKKK